MLDFKANGEAGMLFPINGEAVSRDTTYRLERLEVYNWGPFNGLHRADFDSIGTAIIGPTGSGKTTLVDEAVLAITTDALCRSTNGYSFGWVRKRCAAFKNSPLFGSLLCCSTNAHCSS